MNAKRAWMIVGIGLLINAGIFYALNVGYNDRRDDLARYQTLEDQNHNKTTQDLEICMANAVINHAINWKNECLDNLLPESCGLPKANLDQLAQKLADETAECKVNHQYQIPTEVGPAFDSQGNPINRNNPLMRSPNIELQQDPGYQFKTMPKDK